MSLAHAAPPPLPFLAGAHGVRRRRLRAGVLRTALLLLEAVALVLAGALAAALLPDALRPPRPGWGGLAGLVAAALLWANERGWRHAAWPRRAGQLALATLAGAACLVLLGVAARGAALWAGAAFALAGLLLTVVQTTYRDLFDHLVAGGHLLTHVAVLGDGPAAHLLCERLGGGATPLVRLVGRYRLRDEADDHRGGLPALLSDCRLGTVDAVVVALEPGDHETLATVRRALRACVQDVYFAAELLAAAPPDARVFALGQIPLLLVQRRPLHGWRGMAKTLFDQAAAWALIVLVLPVLLVIALAIRLDTPGPILFRQLRVGYNNRLFSIMKFRSMHWSATDRLAKQQTVRGDKRVTRVGHVIRRLSLDELPQLFNVVRGEMSLVGPRPHAPGTSIGGRRVHTLVDDYACRHAVRPGITGLAQVRGLRGGLHDRQQVRDRIASDLEYIERWSFRLDLKILLWTVLLELRETRGV